MAASSLPGVDWHEVRAIEPDEHTAALRKRYEASVHAYYRTGHPIDHQALGESFATLTAAVIWQRYNEDGHCQL